MLSYDSGTPKTEEAYPIPISGVMRMPNVIVEPWGRWYRLREIGPDKLYALNVSESAVHWRARVRTLTLRCLHVQFCTLDEVVQSRARRKTVAADQAELV